jgi:hypothetical protein
MEVISRFYGIIIAMFGLTDWTLEWYNGAVFAPEYLYENGIS